MITLFAIMIFLSIILPIVIVLILWNLVTKLIEKIIVGIIELIFGFPAKICNKAVERFKK